MKKIVAYITILAVILSLASCAMKNGGNHTDDNRNHTDDTVGTNDRSESSDVKITKEQAKSIALTHASLAEDQIYDYEIELDRDFGAVSYEIEFKSGNTEYSYDIDAESGEIIKSEKEIDHD